MGSGILGSFARIYTLLLISGLALAADQVVLDPPRTFTTSGILRRFSLLGDAQRKQILRSAFDNGVDIWQVTDSHIDIYTPPHDQNTRFGFEDIPHTSSYIETKANYTYTRPDDWRLESFATSEYHATYHPLFEIEQFMDELQKLYPDTIKLRSIGRSFEGRDLRAITLSAPSVNSTLGPISKEGKLGFVIGGAQHAREWIATAAATYIAHALVAPPSQPYSLRHLLDIFDFHIIPVPNPDGYTYTWETDRYWYKNRQVLGSHLQCVGVDMNRNWGFKWKHTVDDVETLNTSSSLGPKRKPPADPCSHWYPGHRPFESPEVNSVANFATTLPNLVGFLDLRSYGQMLSAPFSHSCTKMPKDAEDMLEAATGAAGALKSVHGVGFTIGSLCDLLYPAPGNIIDWMYKKQGIKFTFAAHLRDTGTYGFSLPEKFIRPVGEETSKLVEYLSKFIPGRVKRKS
ncbi:hypothetical protein Agabi119p4_10751 [Agaricus bisporus var. burnettii]|uniref:Inactive metallocarboxypeptidase ECM14 n=1 Tax=Agaricus bisporus var. burnettii TaxID=192524 RepID=A0A8H7EW10_AGABI|nr:hypothetical protein Agabi119p4_10751 [Agaricus bisporus var. burnettii]